ncbi:zf-CHY-domain-containing protein [Rhizoclosmatium globosum]|uniref:Zf-CHY-domain-containing protein n=1 Tax=Rhizoclosmatium globosum TaxID=329046 RepID=A0A1Y2C621_9FUNG|nr:zf-CHY-domain-containing protein [Rhizoclosmatium globosum]|eukprot:ORY42327.1 zf-CHY-domain-containing protein [Rhizoclosmatium globosum]
MTSQWSNRQRRHSSRSIGASNKLDNKTEDFGIVTVADTEVSFHDKDRTVIGCKHYQRSCKLQAHCCGKWYPCRFCHDEVSDHNIIRNLTVTMMCMFCKTVQPSAQVCINPDCQKAVSKYYCKECKLWDNDPRKNIYHCYDCGICRIGKGLGIDYFHCKKCNVCMAISLKGKHKCIERNLESDCPICGEYMFTSTTTVIFMPCGHCIHYKCHQEYIQTSYQCPTCFKSLANMTEYFRRIDAMLAQHQMPPEYNNSYSYVYCNDCEKKCHAKFHFLYHKCIFCRGYNTKILQTLEVKDGVTLDSLNEALSPTIATAPSGEGVSSQSGTDVAGLGELMRQESVQSIRHISSATPGFSTSNTSVLSAATGLSTTSMYASLTNAASVTGAGGVSRLTVEEEEVLGSGSGHTRPVSTESAMDTSSPGGSLYSIHFLF